ncbi:hypothetical protein D3C71_2233130 [compost metagenome]
MDNMCSTMELRAVWVDFSTSKNSARIPMTSSRSPAVMAQGMPEGMGREKRPAPQLTGLPPKNRKTAIL